jgi:hypothetical protein
MACNKVQFQKDVSLNEFLQKYGTEEQCFDAVTEAGCFHDRIVRDGGRVSKDKW